ncbi:MAG: glycosyltransferase [Marmoricola sp.]
MRILMWHVHGSWATAFVEGPHDYFLPLTPGRDADGLGRARTWDWPSSVVEVPVDQLRELDVDVVVLQRPEELALAEKWTGRRPGRDVPAVYVEHNAPLGDVPCTRHPLADQSAIPIIHVTHFNRLMWDCGDAPVDVVEHGIIDPGHRYTGELARAAVVTNDPVRRGRTVGADLMLMLARRVPVDVFGMNVARLAGEGTMLVTHPDLSQAAMHEELSRRRVYVHTCRWTSLGLSLLEAMHLGLPVVALATTEAAEAVPPGTGFLTNRPDEMLATVQRLLHDPAEAHQLGAAGRRQALARYGVDRFLADWDDQLARWVGVAAAVRA